MILPLFFCLLFLFAASCLYIGKRAKASCGNSEDYFLMGRSLGLFSLVMTLLATQIGGGLLFGSAQEAYTRGWVVLLYPLGMVFGLLLLGLGFGAKMRNLRLSTVAEIFEKRYGSKSLRKIAALLSIASLFFILIAQAIAAKKFFATLGFDGGLLFSLFWLVLVAYTVVGGLRAVVLTDMLQTSFILVVFGIVFFAAKGATPQAAPVEAIASGGPSLWMTWLLMPLFFMMIGQDMGQRCFAAKSPKVVSLAFCLAAGLLFVASLGPIFLGTMAQKCGIEIPDGTSVLIGAARGLTSPAVATTLTCAILMAIVSTADSLLCSITSNVSLDFGKQSVSRARMITLTVGLGTLVLSFVFDNVVALLMFSYKLSVCVLFVPITMGILFKKPKKTAAIVSMSTGIVGFALFPHELWTMGASFASYFALQLRTTKEVQAA